MSPRLRLILAASLALVAAACGKKTATAPDAAAPSGTGIASPPIAPIEVAQAEFDALISEITRTYFAELPETATYYGAPAELAGPDADRRLNARSPAAEESRRAAMEASLDALKEMSGSDLGPRERRIADIVIALLDGALAPGRIAEYGSVFNVYGFWYTPYAVLQNSGPLVDTPNMLDGQIEAIETAADAEAFLARLAAFGPMLDEVVEKMRADAALGVAPPDFILAKARAVIGNFTASPPAGHGLALRFAARLKEKTIAEADALAARAVAALGETVYPAELRLAAYLDELAATAVHDAGIWRLPSGPELYQAMIRHMTDTTLSADEIHEIGLAEVARIHAEMDVILKGEGLADGSVGARMARLADDPRFFYPNTEDGKAKILADIDSQLARVNAEAPKWFGALPKYALAVRRAPAFSEDSAPSGYYDSPTVDGERPGTYWINLRDTAIWPKFAVPTLTYHEAAPGHHFQSAIALGQDQPLLLSALSSNAFGEGWALYSEALAKEMGLYAGDPFGDLGRLQDELHRAIRLVVDTGMHARKWSRERAIDYMATAEGIHPKEIESEIERYAAWPGQALGYKIGMLKIQELRRRAESELGAKFDIRAFHDEVLKAGGVPLSILEANIERWIAATKGA
jgi:uncharacterized protein (DUF885 family)